MFIDVCSQTSTVISCSFLGREGLADSVDKEVVHPDNSLSDGTILTSSSDEEDEDDSSSLSSKGEGERLEESLVRCLTFCHICLLLCRPWPLT